MLTILAPVILTEFIAKVLQLLALKSELTEVRCFDGGVLIALILNRSIIVELIFIIDEQTYLLNLKFLGFQEYPCCQYLRQVG